MREEADFSPWSWEEVLCIVQSWCFVGLLFEILTLAGLEIKVEDLNCSEVRIDGSVDEYLMCRDLPAFLHVCRCDSATLSEEERDLRFKLLQSMLETASNALFYIQIEENDGHQSSSLSSELRGVVLLSNAVLGEHLDLVHRFYEPRESKLKRKYSYHAWGENDYVKTRMIEAGWCSSEVFTLIDYNISCSALYYLSMMDRHTLERDHTKCSKSFRCSLEDLDVDTYKTLHTSSCSKDRECQDVDIDVGGVLAAGHIPLLTIEVINDDPRIVVTVSSAEPSVSGVSSKLARDEHIDGDLYTIIFKKLAPCGDGPIIPYVCISHVWAE